MNIYIYTYITVSNTRTLVLTSKVYDSCKDVCLYGIITYMWCTTGSTKSHRIIKDPKTNEKREYIYTHTLARHIFNI